MPVRPARLDDLPAISAICAASFWDEEVVGAIKHPYRHEYPQDYADFWTRRVLEKYWDYSRQMMVFYVDGGADSKTREVVVGVADWHRMGVGWERVWAVRGWWDPRNLIKPLIALRNRILSRLWPNRAAEPAQLDLEARMYPYIRHLWCGSRANCWDLACLAVAPAHQKHGYGRQLVDWGLEQARREGVAASVLSAAGREQFYRRCGYGNVVARATDGVGNPLAGKVTGGAIMFRDASDRAGEMSERTEMDDVKLNKKLAGECAGC